MRWTNTVNRNSVRLLGDGELYKDIFFYTKWLKGAMFLSIAWFVPLRSFVSQLSSPRDYTQPQIYGRLSCVKNKQAASTYLHWWIFLIQKSQWEAQGSSFQPIIRAWYEGWMKDLSSFRKKPLQQSHWSFFGRNPQRQPQLQCERLWGPQHGLCAPARNQHGIMHLVQSVLTWWNNLRERDTCLVRRQQQQQQRLSWNLGGLEASSGETIKECWNQREWKSRIVGSLRQWQCCTQEMWVRSDRTFWGIC